jgi:hypothetical protein
MAYDMFMDRVLLSVKRFKQFPAECAIASAASLANYYEPEIDYEEVRSMLPAKERPNGLYAYEQAILLNEMGFYNATIVTSDLTLVDFTWQKLSKKRLIGKLRKLLIYYRRTGGSLEKTVKAMVEWLDNEEYNNRLIIDHDYPKYIRRTLDSGRPIICSFNWTSMFKFPKYASRGDPSIVGEADEHSVVLRGYDSDGVFVVDSHYEAYRGKNTKYRKGYYKLPWPKLLINMQFGDLLWVS